MRTIPSIAFLGMYVGKTANIAHDRTICMNTQSCSKISNIECVADFFVISYEFFCELCAYKRKRFFIKNVNYLANDIKNGIFLV